MSCRHMAWAKRAPALSMEFFGDLVGVLGRTTMIMPRLATKLYCHHTRWCVRYNRMEL